MPDPLPTRRAFRPDGQHYRTFRRQGLTRPGDPGSRSPVRNWLVEAALFVAAYFLYRLGGHGGIWASLFGYGGLVLVTFSLIGLIMSRRRR